MRALARDFIFALRTLRRSPAFAITAIVTIALGIGASTAIFSVVNAVLLRPLPYADQERLVLLQTDLAARNVIDFPFPPGDMPDLRRGATMLDGIAGVTTFPQTLIGDNGEPELVRGAAVTPNTFQLLGARIQRGRDFVESDGTPNAPPPAPGASASGAAPAAAPPRLPTFAIISNEFWRRRFGADPGVIGKSLRLGNQSAEVVGVLAPGFELLWPPTDNVARNPDVFVALRTDFDNGSRINVFLRVVARLKPGVRLGQAQGQIDGIVADLKERFPIKKTAGLRWRLEPMQQDLVADVKPAIIALMGAVVFVLLIACANVANLQLVRSSVRERELAVRAALGGSRWLLARQMLAESLTLSLGGAVLGIALAGAGLQLLLSIGPENLPRLDTVRLDLPVLGFTILAAVGSAALFGLVPAISASRVDVAEILRSGGRTGALAAGKLLRNSVVIAEVALSFVLLVGGGLMARSFVALHRADPGYDPSGVLTLALNNVNRPQPEARAAFMRELRSRLGALPGVQAVTSATPLPLDGATNVVRWGPEAAAADPTLFQQAALHVVEPGYFAAMRTRLLDGRAFTDADNAQGLHLAIVDRVFAAKAFPGQSAVGRHILARVNVNPEPESYEIIGVVDHQRHETLARDGREAIFLTTGFFGFGVGRLAIRAGGNLDALAQAVRSEIHALDGSILITDMKPMQDYVDKARAPTRFALVMIAIFAVVAVVLAAVGLYGVLSTVVRQRTAEIGVRMAFGAPSASIFRLVVGQGLGLSGAGIAVGLFAAFALTRLMSTMLVGVAATDPATFAAIALLFLAIAALACWLPARRAAALDPVTALREE